MMYAAENFPTSFTAADGTEYPIHSDFREWIRFESLLANADVPESLKFFIALRLIFADNVPDDFHAAHEFAAWFYRGGKELPDKDGESGDIALTSRRVYDYEYDSEYIFAAFMEQYGIDLAEVPYLHWWKFLALFKGLHDCKMTDIMSYRGAEITDDLPDSRKAFLMDMQEMFELPVSLTEQRRIEAARKFLEG